MLVIHARGNETLGIGNLARSFELIKYLTPKYNIVGVFECDEDLFSRYNLKNIHRSENLEESLKLIKQNNSTIYICDIVAPDKKLSDSLREIGIKKIIHFNEIEYGFEPDILFVTDGFDYNIEANCEIYRGFEYYIVGEEILKNRKKEFSPIKNIQNVLICFGGADPAHFTEYFTKIINDSKYNYSIVLGPAMPKERKTLIKSIKKNNITYIDSPRNMTQLLLKSDLLVTLGGMTTYEAMCLGIPASAVRWEYLSYNVKSFGEKKMINDLGDIEDAYDKLLNLDIKEVNNICKNAFNIIDGKALQNIESVINSIEGIENDTIK